MRPTAAQRNEFLARRPLPGVAFQHNDGVDVIAGDHAGDSGSIVSVERLGDNPDYLVELSSGQDAIIGQLFLRLVVD